MGNIEIAGAVPRISSMLEVIQTAKKRAAKERFRSIIGNAILTVQREMDSDYVQEATAVLETANAQFALYLVPTEGPVC